MKKHLLNILTGFVLFGLMACEHREEITDAVAEPFRIRAELPSSGFTRSVPRGDDGFSVGAFSNGDEAGFFSNGGDKDNGNAPFENELMKFESGYFTGENMSVDINRLGKTLLYYPYSDADNGRQSVRGDNGEVIDLLYSTTVGDVDAGSLVATFHHTFSMFIIDGGLGFENINLVGEGEQQITVTMEKPLETVEFQRAPDEDVGYKVVFNGGYAEGTQLDARYAEFKGHYNSDDNKYYIIVPNDGVTKVRSINAKDNTGREHKIKWPHGRLEYGKKYPITLELDELVPVINLHAITPWDKSVELEANQEKGISSVTAFKEWMQAYNATPHNEEVLLKFGDKIEITNDQGEPTGEAYWHFYLTANIDLSHEQFGEASYLINNLNDVFDGGRYSLSGLTLKTGDNAALIQTMDSKYARVENLIVKDLTIHTTGTTEPVGALVKEFKQGTVRACSFHNLFIGALSSAGVIAGTLGDEAKIELCGASGNIFATGTVGKIIGNGTLTSDNKKGCDVSNVMFGKTGQ